MAGTSINLLPVKKVASKEQQVIAKLGLWIGAVVVIYVLIVGGILGYGLFLSYQKDNVIKKNKVLESEIKTLNKREFLVLALKARVKEITTTINNRSNYTQIIEKLDSLATNGVKYISFEFSKSKLLVTGQATNAVLAGNYFDNLKKEETFKNVLLSSLSRAKDGSYGFSLEFIFNNEK
jgi:hypothetical protein